MKKLGATCSLIATLCVLGACGDKGGATTNSASPSGAPAGSAAAKAATCSDPKALKHSNPDFCISVPDGFTMPKDEEYDDNFSIKLEKQDGGWLKVKWYGKIWTPKRFDELKKLDFDEVKNDKDKTTIEEGSTNDKNGSFIFSKNGSGQRWMLAVTKSSKTVFECSSQDWEKEPKEITTACKTLQMLE